MTESLEEAVGRAAAADRLLVALDFDGTLAPFTEDPADSRPLPAAREALDALAQLPRTTVAVISGRPLGFLREVVNPERSMVLSGSHGAELDLTALPELAEDAGQGIHLSTEQASLLDQAVRLTHELVRRYPGSHAEVKPAGVAFHTRPMSNARAAEQALAEMTEHYRGLPGLRITPGQQVVECSVLSATKADGLGFIQAASGPSVTVFAGDDVTDEDAMRLLTARDVGIKVGDKESAAAWRVTDPQELAGVLSRLAHERARIMTSIT